MLSFDIPGLSQNPSSVIIDGKRLKIQEAYDAPGDCVYAPEKGKLHVVGYLTKGKQTVIEIMK